MATHTKPKPTITQVRMIELLNAALGTAYPVPATETDARFLIEGLLEEERKTKRLLYRHAARKRAQALER